MNIRKLANDAIEKILYNNGYTNIILNKYFDKFEFSKEDKTLFTKLVKGTVEKKITLAYYLEPYLKKKQKKWINSLLLMSAYQIIYLDIEDYAAVNEAVEIAKIKDKAVGGFVNGVLRNLLRNKLRDLPSKEDEIKYLSIKYSYPTWLVSYLLKDYSLKDVVKIFEYNNEVKSISIRVNTLKADYDSVREVLDQDKITYYASGIADEGLEIEYPIMNHSLFKEGKVIIQGVSSQLVGTTCNPKPSSIIIDLCSAPGSKTAHLSALMNNTGKIFACDIHPHKIRLMDKNFKKWGVTNVSTELIDARKVQYKVKDESCDYVLADVPCSGLGVMSHKVDLKYNINLGAINDIIKLQKEILYSSYPLVKKGGYIIYSTCTINKDENEENVRWFIKQYPNIEIVSEQTILPFEYGSDGFYICKMRKKDE